MKKFKAKLLLFGEYGLMKGARALSVPFSGFSGHLSFKLDAAALKSNEELKKYFLYLNNNRIDESMHCQLNLKQFKQDIDQGIWFDSNIPQQYGVGSSGALVAAVFDRYSEGLPVFSENNARILKNDFAKLEKYFHGVSSGIDPLVSYLNKPILFDQKKNKIHFLNQENQEFELFLIDTNETGATAPLVSYFSELVSGSEYLQRFVNQFIPSNDFCIEHYLTGDRDSFFYELGKLIDFQLSHLKRMIPSRYREIIKDSLKRNLFIKLLGSGGGGFLLGFARNEESITEFSKRYQLNIIRI